MIRYLIKNNFKLMFRNTWSVAVMLLGPILVIAVLSSAFSELMKSYEGVDEFTVGYRIQEADNSIIEATKIAGEEAGILFFEYPEGEIKDVMEKNELSGFVEFAEDKYTVYTSADYEVEGITLEYFMNKVTNEGLNASLQIKEQAKIVLPVEQLKYMPAIDSVDYYGIIYIVYFCWCGMICATGVLSNDTEEEALEKFKDSHKRVMEALDTFSQEELFTNTFYPWVGGSCIGGYFISTTSSHYDWAMKKIKAHKKNCKEN